MKLESFAVAADTYEEGTRIDFGEGVYIRVRSANSERSTSVRERLWKPYSTWLEIPQQVRDKLNARWIAQGLLAEMVGFTVGGEPLEVDLSIKEGQDALADILVEAEYKGFRNKVIGIALDDANFQASVDEVTEKNSGSSPASVSSGANTQSE